MSMSSVPKVRSSPVSGSPWRRAPPPLFPTIWASSFGQDPFGLWCGFEISGVEQRMRWIPSGQFLMGSPEDEPERRENELLHRVTLTEGYWLAETACTQALWEALTGNNPSKFKGPDRPVETVHWKEVKEFIEQLNEKVPGLQSQLPTEAQWEYAARAGSQTPFWWGSTLSPEQANYNGNRPYVDGDKGQDRKETVPVKEFEPNPWGLYQVHGNVLEWCEDWYGEYTLEAVVNPRGAESGGRRVYRGGGWSASAAGGCAPPAAASARRATAASFWASACAQVSSMRSIEAGNPEQAIEAEPIASDGCRVHHPMQIRSPIAYDCLNDQ